MAQIQISLPRLREEERRRADNQIWNAAGDYDFQPDFRAFDTEGCAELYWNSIIGAVRKHYGEELGPLWDAVHNAVAEDLCEQLSWLALENACYQRESLLRPAFPLLRRAYAEHLLQGPPPSLPEPYADIYLQHFRRAAGTADAGSNGKADRLLNELELSGELTGAEISAALIELLDRELLLVPKNQPEDSEHFRFHIPFLRKKPKMTDLPPVRSFAGGISEHGNGTVSGWVETGKHQLLDMSEQKSDAAIFRFVRDIFGSSLYDDVRTARLERTLCRDDHENCRLLFVHGDRAVSDGIQGYATITRRQAFRQMDDNREYYEQHRNQARTAVNRLTERWRNAFLTYRQDNTVRSSFGSLQANRVWRLEQVNDDRIFNRIIPADDGGFSVDILLDASLSQEERQQRVALQAYIIAQSLTNCGIPVRVTSFCSLSGYTVLTRYRDYSEIQDNERIFNYTTYGGNRDGLAVRVMGHLMEEDPNKAEHRILLLLSDVKPNDAIYIQTGSESVPYSREAAVENTAREVRKLRNKGVAVLCVYTGTDDDLPAAHKIYNRDFVRIHDLDHFAQAVGNLVLTQLRL